MASCRGALGRSNQRPQRRTLVHVAAIVRKLNQESLAGHDLPVPAGRHICNEAVGSPVDEQRPKRACNATNPRASRQRPPADRNLASSRACAAKGGERKTLARVTRSAGSVAPAAWAGRLRPPPHQARQCPSRAGRADCSVASLAESLPQKHRPTAAARVAAEAVADIRRPCAGNVCIEQAKALAYIGTLQLCGCIRAHRNT